MNKKILLIGLTLFLVGSALVFYFYQKQSVEPEFTSLPRDISGPQDVKFYMGHLYIDVLGMNPVLSSNAETLYYIGALPVYVAEDYVDDIFEFGGGLPSCFLGNPKIYVDGTVEIRKNNEENPTHYLVSLNHIRSVEIKTESCENK